jgi:putrescine transport system substrate-binding protein
VVRLDRYPGRRQECRRGARLHRLPDAPAGAAANANFVAYASGNLAAKQFVKPELVNDPSVYPDEATFKRLFTNTAYDDRSQRLVTRLWTRVKTGR